MIVVGGLGIFLVFYYRPGMRLRPPAHGLFLNAGGGEVGFEGYLQN